MKFFPRLRGGIFKVKTYDIVISEQARIDLNGIDDYISNELLAPFL